MSGLTPAETLGIVADRFAHDRRSWVKGYWSTTHGFVGQTDVTELEPEVREALDPAKVQAVTCFCAVGAIRQVLYGTVDAAFTTDTVERPVLLELCRAIDPVTDHDARKTWQLVDTITDWNDAERRTVDDIIDALSRAAGRTVEDCPF